MKLSEYFRLHPEAWSKGPGEPGKCGCMVTAFYHLRSFGVRANELATPERLSRSSRKLFPLRLRPWESFTYEAAIFNDHPETTLADVIKVLEDAGE